MRLKINGHSYIIHYDNGKYYIIKNDKKVYYTSDVKKELKQIGGNPQDHKPIEHHIGDFF